MEELIDSIMNEDSDKDTNSYEKYEKYKFGNNIEKQ